MKITVRVRNYKSYRGRPAGVVTYTVDALDVMWLEHKCLVELLQPAGWYAKGDDFTVYPQDIIKPAA